MKKYLVRDGGIEEVHVSEDWDDPDYPTYDTKEDAMWAAIGFLSQRVKELEERE